MKRLLLLLLPALAFAQLPPTQKEAQAKFDLAVSLADTAIAEAIWYDRAAEKESLLSVWNAASEEEIRALSQYFRLVIPTPKKEVADGEKVLVYDGFRCGCHGDFVITLKKKDAVLLTFVVAHGEHIGSKALRADSAIKVEKSKRAPFYARLMEATKKKANQTAQTTPGLRPSVSDL
jgi:hypothetical protein